MVWCRLASIVVVVAATSTEAAAGGFYVPEIGPRAPAMGAAMAAQDADSSAIFHNPAGLVGQGGTQLQVSLNLFVPDLSYFRRPVQDPNSPNGGEIRFSEVENENALLPAPYLGAVSELVDDKLAVGFAVYAPFGAAIHYPSDGAQRHVVTSVDLKAIHASFGAAYRLSDRFRVGASINYIYAELGLEQRNAIQYVNGDPEVFPDPDPAVEGDTVLSATDPFSISASIGAMYSDPSGRFNVGVSLLTPVTLRMEGDADVRNEAITELMDENGNMLQPAGRRTDTIRTSVPLPLIARIGVTARPHPRALVAFDVNWQRWSTFEQMKIDFEGEYELLPSPGVNLYDVMIENNWRDSFSVRLGGQYQPLASQPLALRAGVLYDQSPIEDNHFDLLTPDSDKIGVGVGLSYAFLFGGKRLELDVAYQHLFVAERDVTASEKTILNKPAPSFYNGVTRAGFDNLMLSAGMRF